MQAPLRILNIVDAIMFTGAYLPLQSSVTDLHFVGGFNPIFIGLKNLLTNLPALTTLTIPKATYRVLEYTRASEDSLMLQRECQTEDVVFIDLQHLRSQLL